MRSIGPFVAERFLEIVKARNNMARLLGFEDFYDYKVHVCMYLGLQGYEDCYDCKLHVCMHIILLHGMCVHAYCIATRHACACILYCYTTACSCILYCYTTCVFMHFFLGGA